MQLKHPIEEYFKYHPVTTPERKAKHDMANNESLGICNTLWCAIDSFAPGDAYTQVVRKAIERFQRAIAITFTDPMCQKWLIKSLDGLMIGAMNRDKEAVLQSAQQARMFANQGITLDSISQWAFEPEGT
jgi:hypothetical protein